jgi:PilZ domain
MAATVGISRVYLNEDGQGVITCHHCDVKRPIRTSQHLHESIHRKLIKTKCKNCERIFYVRFNCRKFPRIPVHFPGKLVQLHTQEILENVRIISLSLGGISFLLTQDIPVNIGDVFDIQFVLDDDCQSTIQEEIIIRRTNGPCIGAEFSHHDTYKYELDFYISAHGGVFE